jgi:hypothetical protein
MPRDAPRPGAGTSARPTNLTPLTGYANADCIEQLGKDELGKYRRLVAGLHARRAPGPGDSTGPDLRMPLPEPAQNGSARVLPAGPVAQRHAADRHHLGTDAQSIIGWLPARQPRIRWVRYWIFSVCG